MALYILKNQRNQYLNKQLEWVSDCLKGQLFSSPHRDIIINQLIELNSQDIHLRAEIITCKTDNRGLPVLDDANQQLAPLTDPT